MSEPEAEAPPRPPSRRRLVVLGGLVVLAIAVVVVVLVARRHHAPSVAGVPRDGGGSAAVRAPEGPKVPVVITGVHLTGFVVDGAGLPVSGAEVTAEQERGPVERAFRTTAGGAGSAAATGTGTATGSGSATATGTGSATATGSGSATAIGPATASTVFIAPVTGVDGRFTIEGLVAGRFRIRVTGPGLLAAEVRFVPVPSDAARIVVAREVAVDGIVTDGGKPEGNAHVGLRGEAIGGTIETTSDGKGAFHFPNLPEGRYQLFAWQGAAAARAVRVNRLGAGPFAPIELHLEAATIVVGRVIDRDEGTPVVAAVELRASGDDQAPRYARTGPDGVFRIEGVPNGKWIADAFSPGYLDNGGVELEAGHGIPELALARGGAIEGRVLDGEGRPVAGAAVRAIGAGTNGVETSADVDQDRLRRFSGRTTTPTPTTPSFSGDPQLLARGELGVLVGPIPPIPPPGAQVARAASVVDGASAGIAGEPPPIAVDPARASIWVTGSDGRYRIRGFAKSKVTVLALAPGLAEARSKQVAIDAGQLVDNIDIVVTAGTLLVGRVTDQHGTPVIGAEVSAAPEVGAPLLGFTDDQGTYKLGPLTGTIELRATAYGHGDARVKLELAPVTAAAPVEQHQDLVLEVADAVIAGILDDETGAAVGGAHLEIVMGMEGRHAIVAPDGTFSLDLLPRGHLRLRVEHPEYPPAEFDVVAGEERDTHLRLRLPLGGAVEGALLEAASGSPLTGIAITGAGPGSTTSEATTDKNGRWKLGPLRPGHWKLGVKLPGYLPLDYETDVPVARVPGGTSVRDVRLELARGAMVGGTVRDGNGKRAPGAHVIVRRADGVAVEGDTDAQGEFRLRDCPSGELEVVATKGDTAGRTTTNVRAGDEVLSLSIELR